jgi:hypothetical protein
MAQSNSHGYLVLDYLLRHGHVQAFVQVQQDLKLAYDSCPEKAMLRKLIFTG